MLTWALLVQRTGDEGFYEDLLAEEVDGVCDWDADSVMTCLDCGRSGRAREFATTTVATR